MITVAKTPDHPLESGPVSGLQISLRVPSEAFAKRFGLPFKIVAQSVFLGLNLIPGRRQGHQGDPNN
jgi:hypothetical protein